MRVRRLVFPLSTTRCRSNIGSGQVRISRDFSVLCSQRVDERLLVWDGQRRYMMYQHLYVFMYMCMCCYGQLWRCNRPWRKALSVNSLLLEISRSHILSREFSRSCILKFYLSYIISWLFFFLSRILSWEFSISYILPVEFYLSLYPFLEVFSSIPYPFVEGFSVSSWEFSLFHVFFLFSPSRILSFEFSLFPYPLMAVCYMPQFRE